jgi:hypothetical protein
MTNLSCAARLFESCDYCRAVAVSAAALASAIYAQQHSCLVSMGDVAKAAKTKGKKGARIRF